MVGKVMPNKPPVRLEREKMWIRMLKTMVPCGLNKND
jgi:hypothetical protein